MKENSLILTKELYEYIEKECNKHYQETNNYNDVALEDVIYSFLFSDDNTFRVLCDWDEGKDNDPFWNEETNEHSAISFLRKICQDLIDIYRDQRIESILKK